MLLASTLSLILATACSQTLAGDLIRIAITAADDRDHVRAVRQARALQRRAQYHRLAVDEGSSMHRQPIPPERLEQAPAASVWTRNKTEGNDKMAQTRFALVLLASLIASMASAETLSPEADACKASGLLALKQKYPQVKDVLIDLDSAKIIKADTKIETVPVKTVVIGDANGRSDSL